MRQRFSLDIGRVSSMRTRSPTWLSLASSCAFSFLDIRMTRWYLGWRYTRSIRTTRVFCIASLTTTPSRLFRSPTAYPFAFFLAATFGALDVLAALVAFRFAAFATPIYLGGRSARSTLAAGFASVAGGATTRAAQRSRLIVYAHSRSHRAWPSRDGVSATP